MAITPMKMMIMIRSRMQKMHFLWILRIYRYRLRRSWEQWDIDDDGDGVLDSVDPFPLDSAEF